MGTCYRLCKIDQPVYLDLGKSSSDWFIGDDFRRPFQIDPDDLTLRIDKDWDTACRMADKIVQWAGQDKVILVADVGFDALDHIIQHYGADTSLSCWDYKETGSVWD
jgi:hypothetical protein